MSADGKLRDTRHGVVGFAEEGKGQIKRYSNGQPTRFTFKKRFQVAPNVQITPIFPNPQGAFRTFFLYLLHPSGGPPVDTEGFYLGIFTDVDATVDFEFLAVEIHDIDDK
ncbi:hypothetical protein QQS21_011520 [Conoideocrella luteorostrata]|uniref:Uncharacterized protein n=1 Tax=Conoideocrella luteorostrata TaxID=1105319 RepID=A0AAJ0CD38_9HYPO|nr:hypothetical protein QQS21_011520 [Conoideocrella luteorostrata]